MKLLENKTAIITGATRGIGRGIAVEFAKQGANVAFTFSSSVDAANALEIELNALGIKAKGYQSNAAEFETAQELAKEILKEFGSIDVLVNNAGINLIKPMLQMTESEWENIFSVNLKSYWLCARAIAPQMIERGEGGKIINASSKAGKSPSRYAPIGAYSTTKHGVIGFTRSLAIELAPSKINVNCFCFSVL